MEKLVFEIPLEITLLPHYIVDENQANVWLFTGDVDSYYPALSTQQVDSMVKSEAHRHRIDAVGGFGVNAKLTLMGLHLLLQKVTMEAGKELVRSFFLLECMHPQFWVLQKGRCRNRLIYG